MWSNLTKLSEERIIRPFTQAPITHGMLRETLVGYNRPNDKISEMIKEGTLVALRRGLYIPGAETELNPPDKFVIANALRGPSYISLESALSYWGLIPERVYETSSVTLKTSKIYDTPIGRFSYRYSGAPFYSFGLRRVEITPTQAALVARKEKAVCDKIALTPGVNLRSRVQTEDFLIEDMRINEYMLEGLDTDLIATWLEDAPKRSSLEMLIKTLRLL